FQRQVPLGVCVREALRSFRRSPASRAGSVISSTCNDRLPGQHRQGRETSRRSVAWFEHASGIRPWMSTLHETVRADTMVYVRVAMHAAAQSYISGPPRVGTGNPKSALLRGSKAPKLRIWT